MPVENGEARRRITELENKLTEMIQIRKELDELRKFVKDQLAKKS